jgi:hypothetical protein
LLNLLNFLWSDYLAITKMELIRKLNVDLIWEYEGAPEYSGYGTRTCNGPGPGIRKITNNVK